MRKFLFSKILFSFEIPIFFLLTKTIAITPFLNDVNIDEDINIELKKTCIA